MGAFTIYTGFLKNRNENSCAFHCAGLITAYSTMFLVTALFNANIFADALTCPPLVHDRGCCLLHEVGAQADVLLCSHPTVDNTVPYANVTALAPQDRVALQHIIIMDLCASLYMIAFSHTFVFAANICNAFINVTACTATMPLLHTLRWEYGSCPCLKQTDIPIKWRLEQRKRCPQPVTTTTTKAPNNPDSLWAWENIWFTAFVSFINECVCVVIAAAAALMYR